MNNILDFPITEVQEKNLRSKTVSTPLFDITFKEAESNDHIVRGFAGLEPIAMLNQLAAALVNGIVRNAYDIKVEVVGVEAIAAGTDPLIYTLFENGRLKDLYRRNTNKVTEMERMFARMDALVQSAKALKEEYSKLFPSAKNDLQYTFSVESWSGISDLKEAIEYRMERHKPRLADIKNFQDKKNGIGEIAARENMDVQTILGF